MSSQGPLYPGTAVDGGGGGFTWTNPGNAKANDGAYATVGTNNNQDTDFLQLTNFSFSVPGTATINGVLFEVGDFASGNATDAAVYLLKAGSQAGSNLVANRTLSTGGSPVNNSYGGTSNLWGTTLTPSDVNLSTFGVEIQYVSPRLGTVTVSVDYGRLTVYYTTSTGKSCKMEARAAMVLRAW